MPFSLVRSGWKWYCAGPTTSNSPPLAFLKLPVVGVGDRVHLSNPQNETSPDGSSGWIVERLSLTTTSVYWGTTNERATLCNGAIANLRVINAARSPNATVSVVLKFGIDTEHEKVEIFRTAVEQYLKDRPREWLTFVGFRPAEVAPEKGYIGYKVSGWPKYCMICREI